MTRELDSSVETLRWVIVMLIDYDARPVQPVESWCRQTCHLLHTHYQGTRASGFRKVIEQAKTHAQDGRLTFLEILDLHDLHPTDLGPQMPVNVEASEQALRWSVVYVLDAAMHAQMPNVKSITGFKAFFTASEVDPEVVATTVGMMQLGIRVGMNAADGCPPESWATRDWTDCDKSQAEPMPEMGTVEGVPMSFEDFVKMMRGQA